MIKTKNAKSVKKSTGITATTQQHLKIREIQDNTIVLKDGSVRSVLRIEPVNFDLKSDQEQNSIIYGYQSFLNTLEFPVQILVRSKKLDIDMYLEKMVAQAENQKNPLLKDQTYDYIDFIKQLVDLADIMKKEFYVVVPNDSFIATKALSPIKAIFEAFKSKDTKADYERRKRDYSSLKKGLEHRTQMVQTGLENAGLIQKRLSTTELIALFYESYNPETSQLQKIPRIEDTDIDTESPIE